MSTVLDRADLFYKEGTSDKVYHATLEKDGGGYVVNYAYGRRGSALRTGTKTSSPLPEMKAREVFDKLVGEKTAKGYQYISKAQSVLSNISTVAPSKKPVHQCVLLNPIDAEDVKNLLSNDHFILQQKMDGVRFLLSFTDKCGLEGFNRKGIPTSIPNEISDSVLSSNTYYEGGVGQFLVDGELVGDKYYVFDILECGGKDLRGSLLQERILYLNELMDAIESDNIVRVDTHFTTSQKVKAFSDLENIAEGVVFKHLQGAYTPGRPASGGNYLKHKFYETGSFIVNDHNAKRSVELRVVRSNSFGGPNLGNYRMVGNVTIPSNFTVPRVGSVVEVRYLYAYKDGSLYQPVYLGERSDIDESECTEDQLKYKS